MNKRNKRKLLLWEQNWLRSHGKGNINIEDYGEIPVEYITEYAGILGREFKVDKRVLIPRIEAEDFIELVMEIYPKKEKLVIADVGTGSGCIGISLYLELKKIGMKSEVYLSDISEEALEIAKENTEKLIVSEKGQSLEDSPLEDCLLEARVHLIKSDLMEDYPVDLKFDLIVANLPYASNERMKNLTPSVRDYEPHLALDGGEDGLFLVKKLIKQLPGRLNKNGVAILEIDETHKLKDFSDCLSLRGLKGRGNLFGEIKKDQFGKNRFLVLKW